MAQLRVEVVYALSVGADAVHLSLPDSATAADALRASGLIDRHPALGAGEIRLGIYGEEVPPGHRLSDGDRVEVYRPLAMDPKEARRRRALARR